MKIRKTLILATALLTSIAAQAGEGANSFEARSQPPGHGNEQLQQPKSWRAGSSDWREHSFKHEALNGHSGPVVQATELMPVSAVPEPETYMMMLAGLGLIGTIVRRHRTRPGA